MERKESFIKELSGIALIFGTTSTIAGGALAGALVQGGNPEIFTLETGKTIAQILIIVGVAGISLAAVGEFLDKVITSSHQRN